jgi:hypothetical protein
MPVRSNCPSLWLSLVMARSPSYTCSQVQVCARGKARRQGEAKGSRRTVSGEQRRAVPACRCCCTYAGVS